MKFIAVIAITLVIFLGYQIIRMDLFVREHSNDVERAVRASADNIREYLDDQNRKAQEGRMQRAAELTATLKSWKDERRADVIASQARTTAALDNIASRITAALDAIQASNEQQITNTAKNVDAAAQKAVEETKKTRSLVSETLASNHPSVTNRTFTIYKDGKQEAAEAKAALKAERDRSKALQKQVEWYKQKAKSK